MSGIMAAMVGASGATILDTQVVTTGSSTTGSNPAMAYTGYKSATPAFGSIADGTSNIYGGASITGLHFYEESYVSPPSGITVRQVTFTVSGSQSNSGWETMTIGTTSYSRTSASFSAGGSTSWVWNISIPDPFVSQYDPFSGATTVTWV